MAVTEVSGSSNEGISTANPITVTYGVTPTAGNLMRIVFWTRASTVTTPSGWAKAVSVASGDEICVLYKIAGPSEGSSVDVTVSATDQNTWGYKEFTGVDATTPVRATSSSDPGFASTNLSTGSTSSAPQAGDYADAGFGTRDDISSQAFTNSFTLTHNVATSGTVAELTVGEKALTAAGAVETTMSWTTSSQCRAVLVVWAAAGGATHDGASVATAAAAATAAGTVTTPTASGLLAFYQQMIGA